MPQSTDLVTDLPADFETFGQAVATSMADLLGGTTGQVLAKASNTDMDFSWVAQDDSNAIQNAIVDAKGDLIAASAADTPARLAVGTNNQVLTADSTTATGLKWATPVPGKIVQVVSASYSTPTTNTSTSYADTGLTATITPTSASNKILVMVAQNGLERSGTSANQCMGIKLLRGATDIAQIATNQDFTGTTQNHYFGGAAIDYMDSPATTSATTYKTQFNQNAGSGTLTVQINSSVSTMILMEVTP
jgi:hypothetical protein